MSEPLSPKAEMAVANGFVTREQAEHAERYLDELAAAVRRRDVTLWQAIALATERGRCDSAKARSS